MELPPGPGPSDSDASRPGENPGTNPAAGAGPDWLPEDSELTTDDEDGPLFPFLPPEDRLWRHPSEAQSPGPTPAPPAGSRWGLGRPGLTGGPVSGRRALALAAAAGLIGASAATAVGVASGLWPRQTTIIRSVFPTTPAVSLADAGATSNAPNWTAVDDSVAASVVGVSVQGASGPTQGSGLIFLKTPEGRAFIVTDRTLFAASLSAGYMATEVTFLSGRTARGRLVGQDNLSGLAVVAVENVGPDIPAATGTVAELRDAEPVLAVGARTTAGSGPYTGTVSGEDRTVSLADGTDLDNLISVVANIQSASAAVAGGPLLDQVGQVVGLTISVQPTDSADQQTMFAVPLDEVARVAAQLISGQPVTHPWLGIANVGDVPSVMAHQLGLTGGVQAGSVVAGSPASQAGMQAHDIVTSFDGRPVLSTGAFVANLQHYDPGQTVPITFLHSGRLVQTAIRVVHEPGR